MRLQTYRAKGGSQSGAQGVAQGRAQGSAKDSAKTDISQARAACTQTRFGAVSALAGCLLFVLLFFVGCSAAPFADETSPQISDVSLIASSSMTEESQAVEIRITFDQNVTIKDSVASDFDLLIDDAKINESTIAVQTHTSANTLSFTLVPATSAGSLSSGNYFALYEASFELSSARSDGLIPSITNASGACFDLSEPLWGTLPSGLEIDVTEVTPGSVDEGVRAKTVFQVTSPALVRAITWFSVDGGETLLLKHNHMFADADAAACAANLAIVVNRSAPGINAIAHGDIVELTASELQDGQVITPLVVEGVGVAGGTYDPEEEED